MKHTWQTAHQAALQGLHPAIRGDQCLHGLCGLDGGAFCRLYCFGVLEAQDQRPRAGENLAKPPITNDIGSNPKGSGQLANPVRLTNCDF